MDEGTSALDVELEEICMNACVKTFNVTCVSVCHRSTLTKFHQQELRLDGMGNYAVKKLRNNRVKNEPEKTQSEKEVASSGGSTSATGAIAYRYIAYYVVSWWCEGKEYFCI